MADPSWDDTERDDYFGDLGYAFGLGGVPHALENFFHPQANQCLVEFLDEEARSIISNFRVTACEPNVDTDSEGLVYCLVKDEDPGAGEATIEFYRGPNRDGSADDELVATAAGANGATLTIVPETGYTFAGTVKIGTVGVGNDEHAFAIHVSVPPALRLQQLYPGTTTYDAQIRDAGLRAVAAMRDAFATARDAAQSFAAFVVRSEIRPHLVSQTSQSSMLQTTRNVLAGAIEETYAGLLDDLRRAQAANTGGSGEIKAAAQTLAGSLSFPGWQGTASSLTYGQRGVPAQITWRCIKKLTNTPPQFQATRTATDARRRPGEGVEAGTLSEVLEGRPLTIGAEWSAREWGIHAMLVDYKASVTGVTSALLATTAGLWSVTGLTSSNSTGGVLYARYDGSTIKFYRTSAGRTAEDPSDVAASVATTTGQVNTVKQATGASGLVINFTTGAGSGGALVSGSVGDVDFQSPTVTGNSLFQLAITESTEGGLWQKRTRDGAADGVGYYPNVGSSPNILDAQIRRGLPLINVGVSGAIFG